MRNLALAQIDGLSSRAVNCCNDVGIATIGDLFDYVKNRSLNTIRNCGIKTIKELNQLITTYDEAVSGYKYNLFAVDTPAEEPSVEAEAPTMGFQATECGRELDGTELLMSLNEAYAECLDEGQDPLAYKVKDKFPNIESILLLVSQQPDGLLAHYEDWSIVEHFRFWSFCDELLSDMISAVDVNKYPSLTKSLNVAHYYVSENIQSRKLLLLRSRIKSLQETA